MNLKSILLLISTVTFLGTSQATVHRVNNRTDLSTAPGVFTTISAAHTAATAGDTIYVEGSPTAYAGATITKQLVIIGTGYFLSANPGNQHYPFATRVTSNITFNSTSSGSTIQGIWFDGITSSSSITINTSNITVKRVLIQSSISNGQTMISILAGNVTVLQSMVINTNVSTASPLISVGGISNTVIRNCILVSNNFGRSAFFGPTSTGTAFMNNTIRGSLTFGSGVVYNNILFQGSATLGSVDFQNNISAGTDFGGDDGNQQNVVMATVFAQIGTNFDESFWELAGGTNPAIGTGMGGTDCGHYGGGGDFPYKRGGFPGIPTIYDATVPVSGSTLLNVNIKSKSHTN